MPLRSDWSTKSCPIARSLEVLGDPWVLLIVREVLSGVHRYDSLRGGLGIADNVLSSRLRRLVDHGLLVQSPYSRGSKPRTEYYLTDRGADALPVIQALVHWGNHHTQAPRGPLRIMHLGCGGEVASADRCDACGVALTADNVGWDTPSHRAGLVELEGAHG